MNRQQRRAAEKAQRHNRAARNYAGEQLPAAAGTGIVHILESASREAT